MEKNKQILVDELMDQVIASKLKTGATPENCAAELLSILRGQHDWKDFEREMALDQVGENGRRSSTAPRSGADMGRRTASHSRIRNRDVAPYRSAHRTAARDADNGRRLGSG
jgi:hypothetical protein